MTLARSLSSLGAAALSLSLAAAADTSPEPRRVPGRDADHYRLSWGDDATSLNDRCPVRKAKLNPVVAPVYVNGSAIGFC